MPRCAGVGGPQAFLVVAVAVLVSLAGLLATGSLAGATTNLAKVSGQGSTYAALAFQQWIAGVQTADGLNVNYTATGSPAGLSAYAAQTTTFAGTEAEFSELYSTTPDVDAKVPRGFAYTPDVAGAVAVMYHVQSAGGTTVNYLHLTPLTIARIFMGYIKTWTSPTISAENPLPDGKDLVLPHEPITLDLRAGQSGTTALFYDWVKHSDPSQFTTWAKANGFSTTNRVWEVDDGYPGGFGQGPEFDNFTGSDEQAEAIAARTGLGSIGYDEFGYAFVYHDNVAWVENASGNWTQPYAKNIAAALKSAVLAPTTSQTLVGVYNSTTPEAYPMSAYSYILYQCAPTSTRPTCKEPYPSGATINTMSKFMRYIACTGQVKMATIGYSPLPADLSQFLANAIGYMSGQPPATLSASNCANPQFQGNLGVGATPPPDPIAVAITASAKSGGHAAATTGTSSAGNNGTGSSAAKKAAGGPGGSGTGSGTTTTTAPGAAAAVGSTGSGTESVGGGTSTYRPMDPAAYDGPATIGAAPPWPWVVLVLFLLLPVAWLTVLTGRRRRTGGAAESGSMPPGSTLPSRPGRDHA